MRRTRKVELVFAELSFEYKGKLEKRWVVANGLTNIPDDQREWGFGLSEYGEIEIILKIMPLAEIRRLNLRCLEHGMREVKKGVCAFHIIFH